MSTTEVVGEATEHAAAPLDLLLGSAALGPVRRLMPGRSGLRALAALAGRPRVVARRGRDLARELAQVAVGTSAVVPERRDKRFADPAWSQNPFLHRALQAYLAASRTAQTLVGDADLEWADAERVGFAVENLIDAASPSNNPLLSPAGLKALVDTGGGNVIGGLRRLVGDLATPPRVPSMVDADAYTVGENLASTPGAVVARTPVFELIQYTPQTPSVRRIPLLIVPPTINKYYIVDLAPGRSLVEYLVNHGQQVFTISWRNPDARHAIWGFDTYGTAILEAMDAIARITRVERSILLGLCSGGILTAMTLAHLAARGRLDRVAALGLAVSVLDQSQAGTAGALLDPAAARAAKAMSVAQGYLDGRRLAEVFAWLRPNDLIWNYWVNNYLQGRPPPKFDVLFWNADTTRMTAALHHDFLDLAMDNALIERGTVEMLGSPVDLGRVDTDAYMVAGIADHLCPWQNCYRSTQLIGGGSRFVLSTSGHIACIVNPPGNPKANFQTTERGDTPVDAQQWLEKATTVEGSWWPDFVDWLADRSGEEIDAPAALGGGGLPPMEPAPGTYVFDR